MPRIPSRPAAFGDLPLRKFVLPLSIAALLLFAYWPALRGGFLWDDESYVANNLTLRRPTGLWEIWFSPYSSPDYYPLTFSTLWLEFRLWKQSTLGYHLTNLLLHGINSLLLWRLLVRLAVPGAWLTAAIFALHPAHVESVAWITERKDVLSGLFYLWAMLQWLNFVSTRKGSSYVLAQILFIGAMFSKTVTCTFPAALLLLAWWKNPKDWRREIFSTLPFFFTAGVLSAITAAWQTKHFHSVGTDYDFTLIERCWIAARALWFYLSKLLWPSLQTAIYPRWNPHSPPLWTWLFGLAALGLAAPVLTRLRRWRTGALFVATGYFVITLSPALGFLNYSTMRLSLAADHYQYLASIGPLVLLGAAIFTLAPRLGRGRSRPILISSFVLLSLTILSRREASYYKDAETLFRRNAQLNPNSPAAVGNWAAGIAGHERYEEALSIFEKAAKLGPADDPDTLVNFGAVLGKLHRTDEAIEKYRQALRINPQHSVANYQLAFLYAEEEKSAEAVEFYSRALQADPGRSDVHNNLGNLLLKQGKFDEAVQHFQTALDLDPTFAEGYSNLGNVLHKAGRNDEAVKEYQRAIQLDPKYADARFNLGVIWLKQGKFRDAADQFSAVVRLHPDDAKAHNMLGVALAGSGAPEEAEKEFEKALDLQPDYPEARDNLNRVRQQLRKNAPSP